MAYMSGGAPNHRAASSTLASSNSTAGQVYASYYSSSPPAPSGVAHGYAPDSLKKVTDDDVWGAASLSYSPVSSDSDEDKEIQSHSLERGVAKPASTIFNPGDDQLQFLIKRQHFAGDYNLDLSLVECAVALWHQNPMPKDFFIDYRSLRQNSILTRMLSEPL